MLAIFQILDESDTGVLPADKFSSALQAMSSLQVKKPEIETMLKDFHVEMGSDNIDYEEFCSSGNVLRIRKHTKVSTAVPYQPWLAQIARPAPQRGAHVAITWEKHVRWYQRRREHSMVWLVKRAVEAQRQQRVQRKVMASLVHTGKQASIYMGFRDQAEEAMLHFKERVHASDALKMLAEAARRHKANQLQAHETLKMFVKHDSVQKLLAKLEQSNYNNLYYLFYRKKIAFEYLEAAGQSSLSHFKKISDDVVWLHRIAERAKVHYVECIEAFEWNVVRSKRAIGHCVVQDQSFLRLQAIGRRYKKAWEEKKDALLFLHDRGARAIAHANEQEEALEFLGDRGHVSKGYTERYELAITYLLKWGYDSSHHVELQAEAKRWLAHRVRNVQRVKHDRDTAQEILEKKGKNAKGHGAICEKAKKGLALRVDMARRRGESAQIAIDDLVLHVHDARAQLNKRALESQCPAKIKSTDKAIKVADKERDGKRKGMDAQERFKLEMEDAFTFYDTDGSGEIAKIEFRHLLSSGQMIEIPETEIDDCFQQIDKDGSGGVDFDEFFSWFNYEWSQGKNQSRKAGFKVSALIPTKARAVRMLMDDFLKGNLEDDFGATIPPPGVRAKKAEIGADGEAHWDADFDDRWWLDPVSKRQFPFPDYKKKRLHRIGKVKHEEADKKRLKEEEVERKEKNMTHEEKVARQKKKEAKEEEAKKVKREAAKAELQARLTLKAKEAEDKDKMGLEGEVKVGLG